MINSVFNWSGGKDSALALYHILQEQQFKVSQLMTTVNSKHDRISMHGVRRELLQAQSNAIGIPVHEILLPEMPSMSEYDQIMKSTMQKLKNAEITHSIFGDIFLEDLKKYREGRLAEIGLKGHFPLWKRNTTELIHEFLDLGFKTIVVCAKAPLLSEDFVGRIIDHDFIKELPKDVDPCGENGEFHTFVFDGPIFNKAINFELGEKVFRTYDAPKDSNDNCFAEKEETPDKVGFHYIDLISKS
ncbi:diphthine--ammonia ligase [Echinicola sp. CAU 1574]|uniref:Diphthine--ammonia ligase n=1 Tax=Echinicola arenosa TaxID=2774144 RepID=A0ABR9APZ1_9BACT|nr:diphthine--ammonia ligase [Echinicola arenosa]MBD8490842.1 diphthine--ammonia ligase [Echinicola arenosa]